MMAAFNSRRVDHGFGEIGGYPLARLTLWMSSASLSWQGSSVSLACTARRHECSRFGSRVRLCRRRTAYDRCGREGPRLLPL